MIVSCLAAGVAVGDIALSMSADGAQTVVAFGT